MIEKELIKLIDNWLEMNGGLADISTNTPQYWVIIKDLVEDIKPYLGE